MATPIWIPAQCPMRFFNFSNIHQTEKMDRVTTKARSANMRAIRNKDMKPELTVRKLVHSMGYRYRLHKSDLPGRPDLVFPSRNKVIFVHGCFWHQHSEYNCKIARKPKSNTGYWFPKLERNVQRDKENFRDLERQGWNVMIVWECEIDDGAAIKDRLRRFLDN